MPKVTAAIAALLLAVVLTGCAEDTTADGQGAQTASQRSESVDETPAATDEAPADVEQQDLPAYITEPGEVCDPQNMNDSICAAFYPDQALQNVTSRGTAALSDLSLAEKRALAEQACAAGDAGGTFETATILEGNDNRTLFAAAAVAYCPEHARDSEQWPDRTQRLITHYQGLGEEAAKEEFKDGQMPSPDALGY